MLRELDEVWGWIKSPGREPWAPCVPRGSFCPAAQQSLPKPVHRPAVLSPIWTKKYEKKGCLAGFQSLDLFAPGSARGQRDGGTSGLDGGVAAGEMDGEIAEGIIGVGLQPCGSPCPPLSFLPGLFLLGTRRRPRSVCRARFAQDTRS